MPSCFALRRKGETERVSLQEVDSDICKALGVPVSEDKWCGNWYNTIGLALAMGHDWEKIRGFFPEREDIINYLESNYNTDAWWEGK